jgi:CRISPR-associated endonuclease Csn1
MPKPGMNTSNLHKAYTLGLDLGVQSIGWIALSEDLNDEQPILGMGVRCFDSGVGSESDIEQGKDASKNAERRNARLARRQTERRARRRRKIFNLLQRHGLLPACNSKDPAIRHQMMLDLDAELARDHTTEGDRIDGHLLPYLLRAKALDEPLKPFALGRTFFHLSQRRGFLSNTKTGGDDKEEGVVKAGIAELDEKIHEADARTLGEYFAGLDPEEQKLRRQWTARRMFIDEFKAIWDAQASHHPDIMTPELRESLYRAIFYQRPLKSQKHLIGKCELEPTQQRASEACLDAQRFRYWQKICDLAVTPPGEYERRLTPEERNLLAVELEGNEKLTWHKVKSTLGFKDPRGSVEKYEFNLQAGGEKYLYGNKTAARLKKILDTHWAEFSDDEKNELITEILSFEREEALAARLRKAWSMDEETASKVAACRFDQGRMSFSRKAMRRILPELQQGRRLNEFLDELYPERRITSDPLDVLPPVLEAVSNLRNPLVCRALTELRKVVNAVVREYGKPATVRIELARDLKAGRQHRIDMTKRMRENENRRDRAKKKIFDEMGIQEPKSSQVLKLLLAEECNWECPYTGKPISMSALLGANPQFDIEHILPFSRSLDNSFVNKTLCHHDENRHGKRNQTPYEAYSGDAERWDVILTRVKRFQRRGGRNPKLDRFLMTEIPEDFANRMLNDTRYISKQAADYIGLLFGGRIDADGKLRVQTTPGRATATLRQDWGLNTLIGNPKKKDRADHRHHAIDALVVALTDTGTVQQLSKAAERASDLGQHRLYAGLELPWNGFLEDAKESLDAINISYRVNKKVSGALHKETNYSKPYKHVDAKGKEVEYRHQRRWLDSLSFKQVENIVDGAVKQRVLDKLTQLGEKDPKKAFKDPNNLPYHKAKDGRLIFIKKARVRETKNTITVGEGVRARHVATGGNHHMAIVAVLDKDGNEKKWEGHIVSLFEAVRRRKDGEPVVQKDFGPGKKFMFTLTGNEYVLMEDKEGEEQLFRVLSISDNLIELRLHNDARPSTVVRKIKKARTVCTYKAFFDRKARKVLVDPLGKTLPAHD